MPDLPLRRMQQRLARLQARVDWLKKRIQEHPDRNLSFDEAEVAALQWAIEELIAKYPEIAPPPQR